MAAIALASRGGPGEPGASAATSTEGIVATWVGRQVSHGVIVACDPGMCAALREHGFPAGKLQRIRPSSSYPARAQIVVETPVVRRQFGSSLAATVAPASLAAFGSGNRQVAVRIIAPAGAAAFRAQLARDARSRRVLARVLLGSRGVTESAVARRQLLAGQADMRVMIVLTAIAAVEPVMDIAAFGPPAAGESPGLPLRSVLLGTGPPAHVSQAAYLRSLRTVVDRQAAPYHRSFAGLVRLRGELFFEITFPAPSPLGLLPGGAP